MLPESRTFFIRGDDGEEYGPVGLDELREWVRENRAGIGTEVRRADPNGTWNDWQNFPELIALLAEVQVTAPAAALQGVVIAPVGRRVVAFILDLILASILALPLIYVLNVESGVPDLQAKYLQSILQPDLPVAPEVQNYGLLGSLVADCLLLIYMSGFHALHGQTPAKKLLRLRVVDQSGQKPSMVRAFLRAVMLIISMSFCFIPLSYAFFNPQRRALHDLVAGTYVVEA